MPLLRGQRLLVWLLIAAALVGLARLPSAPAPLHAQAEPSGPILADRLGIAFISSAQHVANEARYQIALATGAGWNRWPFYWHEVERAPGSFNWTAYDAVVRADLEHGFQIDAILLGRPAFRANGESIAGLYEPIFSDGTDNPRPGKQINPSNPWADFVARAVSRYMPGGALARSLGWPPDRGVRVWEVWNEPDFPFFWSASVEDYVRLLQVAYITAHYLDPQAQVMFGGLAYTNPEGNDWFARALSLIAQDPDHRRFNFYFDLVGVHNYSYASRSAFILRWTQDRLREVGAGGHPLWLNESGVPVWNDYPGPVWVEEPEQRVLRATMNEQAAFVIQSTTLAWAAGAQVVFHHQLYDDCGNQAEGTDFPPHQGELCVDDAQCWGDAYGLYRNTRQALCFRQHPQPGTPRPSALAYQTLARVFGRAPFELREARRIGPDGSIIRLTFYRPETQERIEVLWNRTGEPLDVQLEGPNGWATLVDINGAEGVIWAEAGVHTLTLPPATNQDYPNLRDGDQYAIGGPPFILIEYDPTLNLTPAPPSDGEAGPGSAPDAGTSATRQPISQPTPGPIQLTPGAPPPPTGGGPDETPPSPAMQPLPAQSPATLEVIWWAEDASGIERYVVWVRIDGGNWQPWLETDRTSSQYVGEAGRTYDFAVWALDRAGNWSTNTILSPMASTTVASAP